MTIDDAIERLKTNNTIPSEDRQIIEWLQILKDTKAGCEYFKDGCCRVESNEENLNKEILKLNEEIKLLRSDNQSLKNMIVKMCYDRYGE